MKKLVKRGLGLIIGSLICTAIVLGFFALLGAVTEWLMVDMGRYWLGMGILGYVLYRCFKAEFGE